MIAYNVYLGKKLIDTVFWVDNSSVDEVRRSLINHDGYDPGIRVVKQRARKVCGFVGRILGVCGAKRRSVLRTVHGRKARFHSPMCAQSFKEDRAAGAIYPAMREEDGSMISQEAASIKYDFCAYCGTRI